MTPDYIDPWLALGLSIIATLAYLRIRAVQNRARR